MHAEPAERLATRARLGYALSADRHALGRSIGRQPDSTCRGLLEVGPDSLAELIERLGSHIGDARQAVEQDDGRVAGRVLRPFLEP